MNGKTRRKKEVFLLLNIKKHTKRRKPRLYLNTNVIRFQNIFFKQFHQKFIKDFTIPNKPISSLFLNFYKISTINVNFFG